MYLSCSSWFEGEDVGQGRDDIDCEAYKEWSNGGIDGSKKWEDDSQKPYGNDHRQSGCSPFAQALALMHPYGFLPHKVQRCACKPKCYKLQTYTIARNIPIITL